MLKLKHRPGLVKPAVILSVTAAFVINLLMWLTWYTEVPFIEIAVVLNIIFYAAGIIVGILSKNRNTIIIAVMSLSGFYVIFKFLPDMTNM